MTKSKIEAQLTSSDSTNIPFGYVGASIFTDDNGRAYHAAIYVCRNEDNVIFHFDKEDIKEDEVEKCRPFLSKDIDFIPPFESGAFLVFCREAIRNPPPGYNFYYNGGYFNREGRYVGTDGEPSYHMTCVGFCLGILKGWAEGNDFIQYTDWNANNSLGEATIQAQLAKLKRLYPGFTDEELTENIRRVKPSEYLASAFIGGKPVRKADTDKFFPALSNIILEWHKSKIPVSTPPSSTAS
jgi:hypothetical protein